MRWSVVKHRVPSVFVVVRGLHARESRAAYTQCEGLIWHGTAAPESQSNAYPNNHKCRRSDLACMQMGVLAVFLGALLASLAALPHISK